MNDETLRLIGRDHTARQTCEAFALARELGFDDINMDVIAGLPGEDEAAFARTMEAVRRLALSPYSNGERSWLISQLNRFSTSATSRVCPSAHMVFATIASGVMSAPRKMPGWFAYARPTS